MYDGELYAAGNFANAGGNPASHIARWNGTSWSALGSGANMQVFSLNLYNGDLVAGGAFASIAGVTANRVARWNGVEWSAFGVGTNCSVYSAAPYQADLIVGGCFTFAGGQTANYIARWTDCVGACCVGGQCQQLAPSACAAQGGTYSGDGVSCQNVNCTGGCDADINGDAQVNVVDLLAVINAWGSCPAPPTPCPADIAPPGGDDLVNVGDLLAVINNWGACP